jgi:LacI family transcriptional regulator
MTHLRPTISEARGLSGRRPGRAATPERHIIFLDELHRHSDREVCTGAAEYAAERPAWAFDPWPVTFASPAAPTRADLQLVSGLLTTERSRQQTPHFPRRLRLPVVYCLADEPHPEADAVGVDEVAVGQMAAEHLWSRGYRQFAFIGSSVFGWSKGRGEGFARWLAQAGKKPESWLFTTEMVPVFWSWNLARRNQRLQELVARLPKPCGVLAANDVIACFVLQAARQNRCRVPEDLGVVGVDNDPFPNAAAGLAISSIELPFREVGRQAARLLEERWEGRPPGRVLRLPPIRVVVRASTDAFMTEDALVRKAQAYVEVRCHQRVTVGEVTRAVGSNRVTLGKHFQRELDTTVLDYLRRRRLAYAADRLRQGDANVDEVALECGFSSASYFSRVFKQVTGQRPGAVRRLPRP